MPRATGPPAGASLLPIGLVSGVALAHLAFFFGLHYWPALAAVSMAALLPALWINRSWPATAPLLCFCVGFGWSLHVLQVHRADRLDPQLNGSPVILEGYIQGLPERHPEYTRFRFQPEDDAPGPKLPEEFLAYWYKDVPALNPGEHWRLEATLRPPWGQVNFQGSDRERWLFANGIGGLATVRSGILLEPADRWQSGWDGWRQAAGERIDKAVEDERTRSVVRALAIADASGLATRDREVFSVTGTAHLMAISGLHVGLAAWCGYWLARLLLLMVPLRWLKGQSYAFSLAAGLCVAFFYSGLAGFGTSTLRALLMVATGVVALLVRRQVHPGQALLLALAGVLLCDPLAPLGAGFWLSFGAVGVLIYLFAGGGAARGGRWRELTLAQVSIMWVLLPLSAWWFQQFSVSGLVANLLAIPWVSTVVVPLVLLGLFLLPLAEPLSAGAFFLAGLASGGMLHVLDFFAALPQSSLSLPQPPLWQVVIGSLGGLLLLLPRGLPHRWLGLVFVLPLFIPPSPPDAGGVQLDVLDVGQGTAVLVSSAEHLLLYDTGPGDGVGHDQVKQVIQPAILNSGHGAPDRIIVSHGDMDHAGGMQRLLELYPSAVVHANLRAAMPGVLPCVDSLNWAWDGMGFAVLHPSRHLRYLANDSSCVLSIRSGSRTLLLPGDISGAVESRLVRQGLANGGILLVPHHGSRHSSSDEFLRGLRPSLALATTGAGNRFGFPRAEVLERYRRLDIPFWATGSCGAIRVQVSASGSVEIMSARRKRAAPWRWPAPEDCP